MNKKIILILILICLIRPALFMLSNKNQYVWNRAHTSAKGESKMKLTSTAFNNNEVIPSKYTCDGANVSPPLTISDVPQEAKSLALIADDPDAPIGTFTHWVMYNIPPTTVNLPENISNSEKLTDGSLQGITDFRRTGYGGPCPPSGTHRYFFKLYALDKKLEIPAGKSKSDVENEIRNHILDKTELMGFYKRK